MVESQSYKLVVVGLNPTGTTYLKKGEVVKTIRLYDEHGNHVLSLVDEPGICENVDLATPSGVVQYCGVPRDLVDTLSKFLPVESE